MWQIKATLTKMRHWCWRCCCCFTSFFFCSLYDNRSTASFHTSMIFSCLEFTVFTISVPTDSRAGTARWLGDESEKWYFYAVTKEFVKRQQVQHCWWCEMCEKDLWFEICSSFSKVPCRQLGPGQATNTNSPSAIVKIGRTIFPFSLLSSLALYKLTEKRKGNSSEKKRHLVCFATHRAIVVKFGAG